MDETTEATSLILPQVYLVGTNFTVHSFQTRKYNIT